ncbi:MAG: NAD(P)H-hydrate dehydratase [Clostridia bacterium]|nr:NAD(P)H-hydrate dehydratase [Clostridia bacterium]
MNILTTAQMREADRYTIETLGVPSLVLMERAGQALALEAERFCVKGKILCVCGGGNNGGDGFVCARILKEKGYTVEVVFFADKTSPECAENMRKYLALGGVIRTVPVPADLVVDCLLGTGFHGKPTEAYEAAINAVNTLSTAVLSADIPSGVNGDNGEVASVAVRASKTLCIGEVKAGVYLGDGIDYAGEVLCVDIGIALPEKTYAYLIDGEYVGGLLPKRKRNTHKGSYGKCAVVAGSAAYTGAAYLAAKAALRSGAGYTALFTPSGILSHYVLKCPELLLKPLKGGSMVEFNEAEFASLLVYDAVAYGAGLGVSEDVAKGAEYLIERFAGRLVLDADALNSLVRYGRLEALKKKKGDVVLTPHIKEFSRLSGLSTGEILKRGLAAPQTFAKEYGVTVLLKNAVSVLTDGKRTAVNISGTAGQAKAGSGDVLAGAIAGLCAGGLSAYEGALAGAYLTGKAAEYATTAVGEYSLLASDVIGYLSRAYSALLAEDTNEKGNE